MQKRKCIIAQNISDDLSEQIIQKLPNWEVFIGKDPAVWNEHLREAEIITAWQKGMEEICLGEQSSLKWLQSWSAGVDTMPLQKFAKQKTVMTTASGVHAYPISETIFALMLALTRKIHTYVKNQKEKVWDHAGLSLEMHNKTIGIIGVGSIGKETAKIAKAFGMTVLGVRHSMKDEDFVDEMFTTASLDEILPRCDYVVVTVPLTNETNQLFGKEQFSAMKPSAFFINIGRGEVVKEEALIEALQNGLIAGAGLDVFEKEPLNQDSLLWEMDNVIITPHTSGSTEYYQKRVIEDIFLPNLEQYLQGQTPSINLVDYDKQY